MSLSRCVKAAACAVALAALAACGGGGGGGDSAGGSGGSGPDKSWLQFSPSTIEASSYGETVPVTVAVTASQVVTGVFNAAIIDAKGVFTTDARLEAQGDFKYTARLNVAPNLAVGTHAGSVEVRLCRDDPRVCKDPIPGSPWLVPYTVTIKSSTNLSPLTVLPGAGPWSMYQGNASHSGFVPASLDPARFSRRFIASPKLVDAVSEGGRVCGAFGAYDVTGAHSGKTWTVTCLDEATGQPLWATDLGSDLEISYISPPALSDGKLYVTTNAYGMTSLRIFSVSTGQRLAQQNPPSSWYTNVAPTVLDGAVYAPILFDSRIAKLDLASGTQSWSTPLRLSRFWAPTMLGDKVLAFVGDTYFELSAATGQVLAQVSDLPGPAAFQVSGTAVVADGSAAYVSQAVSGLLPDGHVSKIDRVNGKAVWRVNAFVRNSPVVVGNVVYVRTDAGLQARSTQDGGLLWSVPAPSTLDVPELPIVPLIVVGHHAFTHTDEGTVAIDLNTRQIVWRDPAVGFLSVSSNGILYISSPDGLVAINLH